MRNIYAARSQGEVLDSSRSQCKALSVIVALAALFLSSGVTHAQCTAVTGVSATLESGAAAIEYNPFQAVQDTDVTINVSLDAACSSTQLAATFYYPANGGTVAGYPGLQLRSYSSSDLLYESVDDYQTGTGYSRSVAMSVNGAVASVTLKARPLQMGQGSIAPAGQGSAQPMDIDIVIKDGSTVIASTEQLELPVQTVAERGISLSGTFAGNSPAHSQSFGTLNSYSDNKNLTTTLYLWNNTGATTLTAESDTWSLIRKGNEPNPDNLHMIPFSIALTKSGSTNDLLGTLSNGTTRVTGALSNTTISGDTYTITVSLAAGAAANKRAGEYKGAVVLTLSPTP